MKRSFSIKSVAGFLLFCLLSACLAAACGDNAADDPGGGSCIPNQSSACTCSDGSQGTRACGEYGTWSPCVGCANGVGGAPEAGAGGSPGAGTGGAGGVGPETGGTGGIDVQADAAVPDVVPPDAAEEDANPPYLPPAGEPIAAADQVWTWIDFPESKCRDGSSTGIGVNLNSASDKVMIYLQGGHACFDMITCSLNPSSFSQWDLGNYSGGVFNRVREDNPVKDWNHVFVPYCTGDVHGGDGVGDPGIGPQVFNGYRNMEAFINRIVPTFPNATQVLITGESAGGFGSALTADLVARTFPPGTGLTVIDDSGPPMAPPFLPACLQQRWRELWGFDNTFLRDCGASCPNNNEYAVDLPTFLATKYPHITIGVISSTADEIIRFFFGYGINNCLGGLSMDPGQFEAGLLDFRAQMQGRGITNLGTFYIPSTQHMWISEATGGVGNSSFFNTTAGGVRLCDWYRDMVEGRPPAHVGP